MNKNIKAFTLVELIVVITILAILGTIGFISLQGFSSDARDSKRISEVGEIRSGLSIYQARNGALPTPSEQTVTIGSGTTDLVIQGYVGESVLNEIRMNGNPKDPLDNVYYTYSVNASKTRFQLLTLLENDNSLSSLNLIPTTHASYVNRFPYSVGSTVGILLQNITNRPLNHIQSGTLNLSTDNTEYKLVLLDQSESQTLSGSTLYQEIVNKTQNTGISQTNNTIDLTVWRTLDPNCELNDIPFDTTGDGQYDQIWAGCNSTLGNGFEWGKRDDGTNGTIGSCYPNYDGIINSSESTCQILSPEMASNSKANSWFTGPNGYGDIEYNTIWGKLYIWSNSPSACPAGWHVPSDNEWITLENYLNGSICSTGDGWQCPGLGWNGHNSKTDTNNLANALKIPLAGNRFTNGSTFYDRGNNAYLWSSTTSDFSHSSAFYRSLNWYDSTVERDIYSKNYAYSVRCIKD